MFNVLFNLKFLWRMICFPTIILVISMVIFSSGDSLTWRWSGESVTSKHCCVNEDVVFSFIITLLFTKWRPVTLQLQKTIDYTRKWVNSIGDITCYGNDKPTKIILIWEPKKREARLTLFFSRKRKIIFIILYISTRGAAMLASKAITILHVSWLSKLITSSHVLWFLNHLHILM